MFAAEIQSGTLMRSLLIAAVIVAPYALYKINQIRTLRRGREAAQATGDDDSTVGTGPRLEDVVATIDRLASDASLDSATVVVPEGVTVDGDLAAPELVDALVRDALRRSGLTATAEIDTPTGRVIEVRRSQR